MREEPAVAPAGARRLEHLVRVVAEAADERLLERRQRRLRLRRQARGEQAAVAELPAEQRGLLVVELGDQEGVPARRRAPLAQRRVVGVEDLGDATHRRRERLGGGESGRRRESGDVGLPHAPLSREVVQQLWGRRRRGG